MKVQLISLTQHPEMTPEQLIVYTARVSNPNNQGNLDTSHKLIKYLIEHKHWSPFEMVDMTVEIETSRAIAQQILRHRSFCYQEMSQRYAPAFSFEPIQMRKQAEKNRQSSTEPMHDFDTRVKTFLEYANDLYTEMLDVGVARECARMILPLTTSSRLYMKGSVRSWIHYLELRTQEDTQLEHRWVAEAIKEIFEQQFPTVSSYVFNKSE